MQKIITLSSCRLLVVDGLDMRHKWDVFNGELVYAGKHSGPCSGCVPQDEGYSYSHGNGCHECGYTGRRITHFPVPADIQLPPGQWQLLGVWPEITEEQAKEVVDKQPHPWRNGSFVYKNYTDSDFVFKKPYGSLETLLTANGIQVEGNKVVLLIDKNPAPPVGLNRG